MGEGKGSLRGGEWRKEGGKGGWDGEWEREKGKRGGAGLA